MKTRLLTAFVLGMGLTIALVWAVGAQVETAPAQQGKTTHRVNVAAASVSRIEYVEAPRQCSQMTQRSLALDGDGHPHIACGEDGLYYFWHDGDRWHQETVVDSGRVGTHASLALASTAPYTPHIAYRDTSHGILLHAHRAATGWVTEPVDSENAGLNASLVLDGNGDPHISYQAGWPADDLRYARLIAGHWVTQTVDDGGSYGRVGDWSSLALEPTAPYTPHISYHDASNNDLKYAYLGAGGWVSETVDSLGDTGRYTSLALDGDDNPHISYMGTGSNLKYAYLGATGWVSRVVDSSASVGYWTSLALDGDDNPHISYRDGTNGHLKYAYDAGGGSWETATVDTRGGRYTSLALDGDGGAHISYYAAGDLKYATGDTTDWVSRVVRKGDDVGSYGSLAIAPTAPYTPHISYHEALAGDLKYAYRTAAGWVSETIDAAGDVGEYTSLALGGDGYPHISYYDRTNGDLKYARLSPIGWSIETVDAAGDVGKHTSLALDGDGYPHISYYVSSNLKYARLTVSGWVSETVDGSPNVGGGSTSLALEPTAPYTPHISYYSGGYLAYAHSTGSGWASEWVDESGDMGEYSSLALDASGSPHIGYYDSDNDHPKYAYLEAGGWVSETIDGGSDGGDYVSLTLDGNGSPHVCYIDSDGPYNLEYARRTGGSWTIEVVDDNDGTGEYCSIELDGSGSTHISYYDWDEGDCKYAHLLGNVLYLPLVLKN